MRLDCGQPEAAAGHRMRLLFGLAPGGVCHALDVTTEAVRSYRTFSPLPCFAKATRGCVFSVALSVGSPLLGVTQRPALWSPDFPPRLPEAAAWPAPHR